MIVLCISIEVKFIRLYLGERCSSGCRSPLLLNLPVVILLGSLVPDFSRNDLNDRCRLGPAHGMSMTPLMRLYEKKRPHLVATNITDYQIGVKSVGGLDQLASLALTMNKVKDKEAPLNLQKGSRLWSRCTRERYSDCRGG